MSATPISNMIDAGAKRTAAPPPALSRFLLPLPDGKVLEQPQDRPLLMGILNVTPDSFSDGGLFAARDAAIRQGERLAEEGADILDIGGESTRPGHAPVSEDEEKRRVLPVLEALARRLKLPISIDTMKAAVARSALDAGAVIVNDVWGLQRDPAMAKAAASARGLVVMHNRETADAALDIIAEVKRFLARSIALAEAQGFARGRILIDPGIGFGKTQHQNLLLIHRLGELAELGAPVLIGVSRKSFIGRILGETAPRERLFGSLAANLIAATAGASVLRVHDVKAHVEALMVTNAIMSA
jgi:dihydropteroate synthase